MAFPNKDPTLQIQTQALTTSQSSHTERGPRSPPTYSWPPEDGLLEQLVGRLFCCSDHTSQVQGELLAETQNDYTDIVQAKPLSSYSFSSVNDDTEEACVPNNTLKERSSNIFNLTKEKPFGIRYGVFMEGMDDLRVTHPITPVASACKTFESCETLPTAVSSTGSGDDDILLDENNDDISCNTVAWDRTTDDESSICSRGAMSHPGFLFNKAGLQQIVQFNQSFSH